MIRVLVVDGVRLFREGIATFLAAQPGILVVGAVEQAACTAVAAEPDIVLINIPDGAGLATVRQLAACAPAAKVVAVGIAEVEDDIVACAMAGISGYVPRDGSLEDLVSAIESATREELRCSPAVAAMLLRVARRNGEGTGDMTEGRLDVLTCREAEIVGLIAEGLSNKQIAACLHLSLSTVKNHVHNAMQKVDSSSRAEMAGLVRSAGAARQARGRRAAGV
jgi:two-component system, NarL family, nitrate/nitrite response regulator NarL